MRIAARTIILIVENYYLMILPPRNFINSFQKSILIFPDLTEHVNNEKLTMNQSQAYAE